MRALTVFLVTVMVVTIQFLPGLTLPSMGPSILWSPHQDGFSTSQTVDYRTLSPKDLVKSVMSEGCWSKLLCSSKGAQQPLDIGLVFVGKELQSRDLSRPGKADSSLISLLKASFFTSNFSLAFPYIAISEEEGHSVESSFVSVFSETCGNDLETHRLAFSESCSVDGDNFNKLPDIISVQKYLLSRMEKRSKGHTDLIVLCHSGSSVMEGLGEEASEGQVLTELISYMEQLDAKYSVLYVPDVLTSIQYPSDRGLQRFLAEGSFDSGSGNLTCDGVCHIKATFLESILVAIVLLIILISGLCCMMGIDTPTRFETPTD
ncbi:unnamed protein product [Cuscuta epithymum]|uniref:V-type proton ATPase subunit S1/VOA1 transmembrane domain-containing protein n=1 Tax=Cuscuta epithymum TaxID=186058 RepID=A0AAV0CFQ6_9ASTE|nr:unnamed protein product [Cuscuta epithymum]CAH9122505.1 unnamed protein product [Cuscuta epithymum]